MGKLKKLIRGLTGGGSGGGGGGTPIDITGGNVDNSGSRDTAISNFTATLGRAPNAEELAWMEHQVGAAGGTWEEAAAHLYNKYAGLDQEIAAAGKAMGLEGFTANDASRIRSELYSIGNEANFPALYMAKLGNLFTNQETGKIRKSVDEYKNPTITQDHTGEVDKIFHDVLGRTPNSRELTFYAAEIARGQSPYEIEQGLMISPEYQKIQTDKESARVTQEAAAARSALDQDQARLVDEAYKRAMPNIIGSFTSAGRLNSSGLDAALAQSMKELQSERQAFSSRIAYEDAVRQQGYGRENFRNQQAAAFDAYLRQSAPSEQSRLAHGQAQNFLDYQFPLQNLQRQYGLQDQGTQRRYDLEDYGMQKNDYLDALGRQYQQQKRLLPYQIGGQLLNTAANVGLLKYFGAFK